MTMLAFAAVGPALISFSTFPVTVISKPHSRLHVLVAIM